MRLFFCQPMQRARKLWWARMQRVVVARARATRDAAVHQMCRSSTSALSIRILSLRGALGRSYSSRVYFRKLHLALRTHRSTSMDRPVLWLTPPSRYPTSFVWLYTSPAASTLNMLVASGIRFVRKHMIFVLASDDTVRPNPAHTSDCQTTPASSALSNIYIYI